jgi:hypothetical protein
MGEYLMESLDEIWAFLERDDLKFEWTCSNKPFSVPFELHSEDFMDFAKEDLGKTSLRSLVNAISNIKRAIDCRIFTLLYFFGIFNKAKKENWNFPKSADFISQTGVLAPNILKKINRKRNELEHDFKKPTYDDVIDYYDIASLFLKSTNQLLNKTYSDFGLTLGDYQHPHWLSMDFDYDKSIMIVRYIEENKTRRIEIATNGEETHVRLLRHLVKHLLY